MASRGRRWRWTVLEDNLSQEPRTHDVSYAVHHSFGRGDFRSVAERVTVPNLVLDQIIGTRCWTERPRGQDDDRPRASVGGAAAPAKLKKMGGVGRGWKAKSSGRARALHLRAQKANITQRKPGNQALLQATPTPCSSVLGDSSSLDHAPHHTSTDCDYGSSCTDRGSFAFSLSPEEESFDSAATSPLSSNSVSSEQKSSRRALMFESSREDGCLNSSSLSASSIPSSQSVSSHSDPTSEQSSPAPQSDTGNKMSICKDLSPWTDPGKELPLVRSGEGHQDWTLDTNTLYFSNIPASFSLQDLEQCIESFGTVTNIKIVKLAENSLASARTGSEAYVRMKDKSSCAWVISCFHGNSFENSSEPVTCRLAVDC